MCPKSYKPPTKKYPYGPKPAYEADWADPGYKHCYSGRQRSYYDPNYGEVKIDYEPVDGSYGGGGDPYWPQRPEGPYPPPPYPPNPPYPPQPPYPPNPPYPPVPPNPPYPPEPPYPPTPPYQKTWIKIVVIDDYTGRPLYRVPLELRLPDGSVTSEVTGPDGSVYKGGLDPGSCDVWCEFKGATLKQTWEYVAMGPKEPDYPPPLANGDRIGMANPEDVKTKYIARIERRKVKYGDTLDTLGAQVGMSGIELAWFNWGVMDPFEIIERMKKEVGTTKYAENGVEPIFSDYDHPGIVFLPSQWMESGLATGYVHYVRVRKPERFWVVLENEQGLPIPEAEYELTFSDESRVIGRLGRGGVDAQEQYVPGIVGVVWQDLDDIKAKSLAICLRKAIAQPEYLEIVRVLGHSPELLAQAAQAYNVYFNDFTGAGLVEDVYAVLADEDEIAFAEILLSRAELPTRRKVTVFEQPFVSGEVTNV